MALFKVHKGASQNLPSTLTEGYCWYTYNDSKFYIDFKDENGVLTRKALNANEASKLTGYDIATILNSSDIEIPTSKAILTALAGKANATHSHDDKYYTESEMDTKLASKSDTTHKHDNEYDAKGSAASVQQTLSGTINTHTSNTDIHVTTTNKSNWNTAYTHSQSAHARIDATKVTDSTTNGNILINDTETNVYTHPNSGVSAGTYKSVTVNTQGHVTAGSNPTTLSGYGITDAETKTDASTKLATAKAYTDEAVAKAKNDLLNGAGAAYDTLKELGDLIDVNVDAIDALETVAANKANASDLTNHINNKSNPHGVALSTFGVTATATELNIMDGVTATTTELNVLDGITATTTELNYVDGVTSNIQTQLNTKQATITGAATTITGSNLTSNRALISDTNGKVAVSAVTSTELGYLDGVTSAVQSQLDGKASASHTHGNITNTGAIGTDANKAVITGTNGVLTTGIVPIASGGTGATTAATALINLGLTATASELNVLDGITATTAELNYIDGVTSNIQTQLNGKAASSHGTHVTFDSTNKPKMDGTAAFGTSTNVARADHVHPTDTSRAAKTDFDNHLNASSAHTKAQVGLGNVDNTADKDKPVSTAQQRAIDYATSLCAPLGLVIANDNSISDYAHLEDFILNHAQVMVPDGSTVVNLVVALTGAFEPFNKIGTLFLTINKVDESCQDLTIHATLHSAGEMPTQYVCSRTNGEWTSWDLAGNAKLDQHVADSNWKKIYDSGAIDSKVNSFMGIDVTGYKKLKVAIKCVNTTSSEGTSAVEIAFMGEGYIYYYFSNLFPSLIVSSTSTSSAMAEFTMSDGFVFCDNVIKSSSANNMFSSGEGMGVWNMTSLGGGIMTCNSPFFYMDVSAANDSMSHYFGVGSRVIVWGCKA